MVDSIISWLYVLAEKLRISLHGLIYFTLAYNISVYNLRQETLDMLRSCLLYTSDAADE